MGKLPLDGHDLEELEDALFAMRVSIIGLNEQESLSFYHLPMVEGHRDPFDRMLVWQAIKRDMALLSSDKALEPYEAFGLRLIR
jgi:PIN domain nuclease of toxin-antitoxin system